MVQTSEQCLAIVVYKDDNENTREEQNCPSFLFHQLPPLYKHETRYALILYDSSIMTPSQAASSLILDKSVRVPKMCTDIVPYVGICHNNIEADINDLPGEIIDMLFGLLDAEDLCRASSTTKDWSSYVSDQNLWTHLCRTKWKVDFNELHLPPCYHQNPKKMYKFMKSVW